MHKVMVFRSIAAIYQRELIHQIINQNNQYWPVKEKTCPLPISLLFHKN